MEKAIATLKDPVLITGRQGSGKTTEAKKIASQFQDDEVVFINYRDKKKHKAPGLFSECTEKTKLVIFEELHKLKLVDKIFNIISNPIYLTKKSKKVFTINPRFVLVCQTENEQLVQMRASLQRRFDVIECKS